VGVFNCEVVVENKKYQIIYEHGVPPGDYCYTYVNGVYKVCPFWSMDKTKPKQLNGLCILLQRCDWLENESTSLLWDQVKECSININ
jgi:hypothetical protein